MFFKKAILTVAALAAFAGTASAATTIWTEGVREQVKDSMVFDDITTEVIGNLNEGDEVRIHGRMVDLIDTYEFTSTTNFEISWLFGGFDLENGGSVAESGFIDYTAPVNQQATISLIDKDTETVISSITAVANITGGNPFIFAGGPGNYALEINGTTQDANYDIAVTTAPSAVPLPAGGVLLLTALGGLGLARRKKA